MTASQSAQPHPDVANHPHYFYRKECPDKPLRPAPTSSATYNAMYTDYRSMLLTPAGYGLKTSAAAFAPFSEHIDRWNDAEWEGDLIGDKLADWMKSLPEGEGRALFEQALERGIDSIEQPPQAMCDFFEQVDATPQHFDMASVQRGADLLARLSPPMHYLANTSLIWVSSTVGPVSRMVGATGRFFDVENSLSRFVETSSYVVGDVSSADVFQRFSRSTKTGVRVRLMHSLIRRQVVTVGDKDIMDYENRGHPMSMRVSMTGGMMFSLFCLWFDASLGGRYSRPDYEDCTELARCISYVNGVDLELLPENLDECCLYIDHALSMCEGITPFTEELNKAFYAGIPKLVADRQGSLLLQKLTPISQAFLTGINQWGYGQAIFRQMPGMPKPARWPLWLFTAISKLRPLLRTLDEAIPGYDQRCIKRMARNRAFSSHGFTYLVSKMLKRSDGQDTQLQYNSHDHSTAADLKTPHQP